MLLKHPTLTKRVHQMTWSLPSSPAGKRRNPAIPISRDDVNKRRTRFLEPYMATGGDRVDFVLQYLLHAQIKSYSAANQQQQENSIISISTVTVTIQVHF